MPAAPLLEVAIGLYPLSINATYASSRGNPLERSVS